MSQEKVPTEYDLLEVFVDEMENRGENRKLIRFSIDDDMVVRISKKHGGNFTLDQLHRHADKCLANEWLEHKVMAGKYEALGLTTRGFGVVRSKQRQKENLANRPFLKKASDFIEDHKGLIIAIGVVIAFATLMARLFSE